MMATEAEQLLSAEQAVQDLLSKLEHLRRETESYSEAGAALAETRAEVAQLVSQLRALTEQTSEVLKVLGEVGTPEILVRLASAEERLCKSFKQGNAELVQVQKQIGKAILDGAAAEIGKKADEQSNRLEALLEESGKRSAIRHRALIILVAISVVVSTGALLLNIPAIRGFVGL
jgi:hypothetical protein